MNDGPKHDLKLLNLHTPIANCMKLEIGTILHLELPDKTTLEIDCKWPDVWVVSRLDPDNKIIDDESITIDPL